MGVTNFDIVQANQLIGPTPQDNPFGATWFVDASAGSDGNTGRSPAQALLTIAQAISNGAAGDNVVLGPGTYTITASLVPKARMLFRAAVVQYGAPTVIITGNVADLIQVDVSGCAFYAIEIKASGATADNLVDVADGADVSGCWFHSCVFNGNDQTSVDGLNLTDGTFVTTGLVVENCIFRDLTGTMIDVGVLGTPYAIIKQNLFAHDVNSGKGIALADTTAFATGKGYRIINNDFTPFDATGDEVGISIAGTEDTTAVGIIRTNYFSYGAVATSITQDKVSKSEVNNFTGDSATGGSLVDPGT